MAQISLGRLEEGGEMRSGRTVVVVLIIVASLLLRVVALGRVVMPQTGLLRGEARRWSAVRGEGWEMPARGTHRGLLIDDMLDRRDGLWRRYGVLPLRREQLGQGL